MRNTRSLGGLRGLGASGAILLAATLAVLAESGLKTASSSVSSVADLTQQPHLLSRQLNATSGSARRIGGQGQLLPRQRPEQVAHKRSHVCQGALSRSVPWRGPYLLRQPASAGT